jgi:hypothetical protein
LKSGWTGQRRSHRAWPSRFRGGGRKGG